MGFVVLAAEKYGKNAQDLPGIVYFKVIDRTVFGDVPDGISQVRSKGTLMRRVSEGFHFGLNLGAALHRAVESVFVAFSKRLGSGRQKVEN
jgi:hypothetical protein